MTHLANTLRAELIDRLYGECEALAIRLQAREANAAALEAENAALRRHLNNSRTRSVALREALRDCNRSCAQLHHEPQERHDFEQSCPVEARLSLLLEARQPTIGDCAHCLAQVQNELLTRELARITADRDAKTKRMWALGKEAEEADAQVTRLTAALAGHTVA